MSPRIFASAGSCSLDCRGGFNIRQRVTHGSRAEENVGDPADRERTTGYRRLSLPSRCAGPRGAGGDQGAQRARRPAPSSGGKDMKGLTTLFTVALFAVAAFMAPATARAAVVTNISVPTSI